MPTLAEVRAKYPQYNDMPDEALASALHQKFYADMPAQEFSAKISLTAAQPPERTLSERDRREGLPPDPNAQPTPGASRGPMREVYDTFIDPFVPDDNAAPSRPIGSRVKDAVAFGLSLPVRIATRGQYGAGDVAAGLGGEATGQGLAQSEQSFVQNNAPQLEAVQAAGDAAMGTMGVTGSARIPLTRERTPARPGVPPAAQPSSMPSSGPARARVYVKDLDELGISRHGPAIAQASRDADGLGTVAKVVEGMPIVGGPLRRSTRDFVESTARAGDTIAQKYSPGGGNIDRAGGALRQYADDFRNERAIPKDDIAALPDAEIARLASSPPRDVGSLKTATDARYEAAWREIPEEMRKGASFADEPRLMGDMPATRKAIEDMYGENLRVINRQRAERAAGKPRVADETGDVLPVRGGARIKQAIPFRGGMLGTFVEDVLAGNWKGNLQTMRDVRSRVRREASKVTDNEGNALNRGQLDRLKATISADMDALMTRLASDYRKAGDITKATAFERALQGFKRADAFTRRYAEAMKDLKPLTDVKRNPEAIGKIITAAAAGAKGNNRFLLQMRRMASPEVLDDTAAAVINEMGRPTGQAGSIVQEAGWSIPKFASQWDSMSPAGRKLIFGHRQEIYAQLEKFANVARGMKDYEALANKSNSGTHGIVGTLILAGPAAVIGNLQSVVLTGMSAYGIAHWLTSPAYINWLTRSTAIQRDIARGAIPAARAMEHSSRMAHALKNLVNRDRDLSPEVVARITAAIDQATKQNGTAGQ